MVSVTFHYQKVVDNLFKFCCILHNMILRFDGRHHLWEGDAIWTGADGLHETVEDDEEERVLGRRRGAMVAVNRNTLKRRVFRKITDFSRLGKHHRQEYYNQAKPTRDWKYLNTALTTHYAVAFRKHEVEWLA